MGNSKQPDAGSLSDHGLRIFHAELWMDAVPEHLVGQLKELASKLAFRASRNRNGSRPPESEQLEEIMRGVVAVADPGDERDAVLAGFGVMIGRLQDVLLSLETEDLGTFEEELEREGFADGHEDATGVVALRKPATHGARWYRDSLRQEGLGRRARAAYIRQYHRRPKYDRPKRPAASRGRMTA